MVRPPRFDARWQRRRAWQGRWRVLRVWLPLALLLGASWWVMRGPTDGGDWQAVDRRFDPCAGQGGAACVIDGDTIMLGARRIRLVGYDAPELDGACPAERQLAAVARDALRDWLNRGPFAMDGGAEPPRDDYGRELRSLRREEAGRDQWLADWMVERGLGRISGRGATGRGWCDGQAND